MNCTPTALRAALAAAIAAGILAAPARGAIASGDVIVADPESGGGSGALIRVDPGTGQQSLLSSNATSTLDLFEDPYGVALDPQGSLLVADGEAFGGTGGVIRVDPDSGEQTGVSSSATSTLDLFEDPRGIAVTASGTIYVADKEAFGGTGGVIKVDPATGQQTGVSANATSSLDLFDDPSGIAVERGGDLAIADYSSPPGIADDSGAIVGIDLDTGQQFVISNNALPGPDLFEDPFGVTPEPTGNLLVAEGGSGKGVLRVSRLSGGQEPLSLGGFFSTPAGIAIDAAGQANVADREAFGGAGGVIRVHPVSGAQTILSTNLVLPPGLFADPSGVMVVPPTCFGSYATIVGTNATDTLMGTSGDDVIVTQAGDDIADGGDGKDLICGGSGRNRLVGKDGNDRFSGGAGPDVILAGKGADEADGEAGRDKIDGGGGKDVLSGYLGRDNLVGGSGNDSLLGQSRPDRLSGSRGNDLLKGGFGRDRLTGGPGRDRLRGGPGKDKQKQ